MLIYNLDIVRLFPPLGQAQQRGLTRQLQKGIRLLKPSTGPQQRSQLWIVQLTFMGQMTGSAGSIQITQFLQYSCLAVFTSVLKVMGK